MINEVEPVCCIVYGEQYPILLFLFIATMKTNPRVINKSLKKKNVKKVKKEKVTLKVDFDIPCYTEAIPCQHGGTSYFGENYTVSCICPPDYGEDHCELGKPNSQCTL